VPEGNGKIWLCGLTKIQQLSLGLFSAYVHCHRPRLMSPHECNLRNFHTGNVTLIGYFDSFPHLSNLSVFFSATNLQNCQLCFATVLYLSTCWALVLICCCCQLSSSDDRRQFITLSVHLCLQYNGRRAGSFAIAETCYHFDIVSCLRHVIYAGCIWQRTIFLYLLTYFSRDSYCLSGICLLWRRGKGTSLSCCSLCDCWLKPSLYVLSL